MFWQGGNWGLWSAFDGAGTQEHTAGLHSILQLHYINNLFHLSFYSSTTNPAVSSSTFKKTICLSCEQRGPSLSEMIHEKMWYSHMFLRRNWSIARYISENNKCFNLIKHPTLGSKIRGRPESWFPPRPVIYFCFFSYILQISMRLLLCAFIFPFLSTPLCWCGSFMTFL